MENSYFEQAFFKQTVEQSKQIVLERAAAAISPSLGANTYQIILMGSNNSLPYENVYKKIVKTIGIKALAKGLRILINKYGIVTVQDLDVEGMIDILVEYLFNKALKGS